MVVLDKAPGCGDARSSVAIRASVMMQRFPAASDGCVMSRVTASTVSEKVVRLIRARVAWANLFARGCSKISTGKLLLAHATQKLSWKRY